MKILMVNRPLSYGGAVAKSLSRFGHQVCQMEGDVSSININGLSVCNSEHKNFCDYDLIMIEQSLSHFVVPFTSGRAAPCLIFNGRTQVTSNHSLAMLLTAKQMRRVRSEQDRNNDFHPAYL